MVLRRAGGRRARGRALPPAGLSPEPARRSALRERGVHASRAVAVHRCVAPADRTAIGRAHARFPDAARGMHGGLRKQRDRFAGGTEGKGCASELRGAAYATSEVEILPDRMITLDRGWDAAGKQVWGSRRAGTSSCARRTDRRRTPRCSTENERDRRPGCGPRSFVVPEVEARGAGPWGAYSSVTILRPVATLLRPVATDERPVATELRPVATDERPVATELRPVATDERPVATELRRWRPTSDRWRRRSAGRRRRSAGWRPGRGRCRRSSARRSFCRRSW